MPSLLVSIIILFALMGCEPGVHRSAWSKCITNSSVMQAYVNEATSGGVIKKNGLWEASKEKWMALSDNQKANIAIGIYCKAANAQGIGKIVINDTSTGKQLAAVVNGHFSEQ